MKEGATYATELELVQENEDETIPSRISLDGSDDFVMFDIETTGLGRNSDITQIAAVIGEIYPFIISTRNYKYIHRQN